MTDIKETQKTIRKYWEQLYANKLYSLKEMDKFLQSFKTESRESRESEQIDYNQ